MGADGINNNKKAIDSSAQAFSTNTPQSNERGSAQGQGAKPKPVANEVGKPKKSLFASLRPGVVKKDFDRSGPGNLPGKSSVVHDTSELG